MSARSLPHRAKPQLLHKICRFARDNQGITRSDVYDKFDENQKTLRKTLDYGVELGFLKSDGDKFALTSRGTGISYSRTFSGQEAIESTFRESIEEYAPYRNPLVRAHVENKITTVKGERVIERDTFAGLMGELVGREVEDREANVFLKTLEAAGLGEYMTGRRGYDTRLIISSDFESFVSDLAEQYPLPSKEEKAAEEDDQQERIGQIEESEEVDEIETDTTTNGSLNITVQLDVSEKSEMEIANIIKKLQSGEI